MARRGRGEARDRASAHLQSNWLRIKAELLADTYKPQAVRRVEIPKPDGGVRLLGIPSVTDRLIQQALLQVLTPICDPTFSEDGAATPLLPDFERSLGRSARPIRRPTGAKVRATIGRRQGIP